jgi:phage terminase large subunit GpA-like protein
MGFAFVDSARCPECDDRITTDDEVGFLRMSESSTGSSELVVCPHCECVIGAIATATYDSILF